MNLTELKVARIRRGVKAQELADALDKTVDSYIKRENGNVRITLSDALNITITLNLSFAEFILIFFDNDLPFRKNDAYDYKYSRYLFPLTEARKKAGLSEEEVAEKLDIPISAYRQREKGKVLITLSECATITRLFNLSFYEFNDIFFRLNLPFRKEDVLSCDYIITRNEGEINAKASHNSSI